ncbi:MAG: septum formation initiator family protein [Ignavibacteria bacterium]|nr:septum formation initiator family protein [Ignavibacteria bacterium]MBI3766701.1 septum formation initiator family protein [Ignavibacteriales bacterium]
MTKNSSTLAEQGTSSPELTERRYVYNGETVSHNGEFVPRGNKRVKRRKRSPFNIIAVLFTISLLIVFYVWNKIAVNRLVVEINDLQNQYQKMLNTNEFLRAEINKKSNLERIATIATGQLGLVYPKEQPIWFEVDAERITPNLR